jgi:carbamoylphosphate synthase large subunit
MVKIITNFKKPLPEKEDYKLNKNILFINPTLYNYDKMYPIFSQVGVNLYIIASKKYKKENTKDIIYLDLRQNDIVNVIMKKLYMKIDGVITYDSFYTVLASQIAEHLNVPHISSYGLKICESKYLQRKFCLENNFIEFIPNFIRMPDDHDLEKIKKKVKYPMIVKPTNSTDSANVSKINNDDELQFITDKLHDQYGHYVIYENFIPGLEIDIDIVMWKGKLKFWNVAEEVVDKDFMEVYATYPANSKTIDIVQKYIDQIVELLNRMKLDTGVFHIECIITPNNRLKLLEINARLAGDQVVYLIAFSRGVNLARVVIQIALDIEPNLEDYSDTHYEPYQYLISKHIKWNNPDISDIYQKYEYKNDILFIERMDCSKFDVAIRGKTLKDAEDRLERFLKNLS